MKNVMEIKAGDWQTLWGVLGHKKPCDQWMAYCEMHQTLSEVLDSIRKRKHLNEMKDEGDAIFSKSWLQQDIDASSEWLWSLVEKKAPTNSRALPRKRDIVRAVQRIAKKNGYLS